MEINVILVYVFFLNYLIDYTHYFTSARAILKFATKAYVLYLFKARTKTRVTTRNNYVNKFKKWHYAEILLWCFYFTVAYEIVQYIEITDLYLLFADKRKEVTRIYLARLVSDYSIQYRIKWIFILDDKKSKIE